MLSCLHCLITDTIMIQLTHPPAIVMMILPLHVFSNVSVSQDEKHNQSQLSI